MRINVLRRGDEVLSVTQNFIAVKRVSGEVDLLPLVIDEEGMRIDSEKIVTIGYGENEIKPTLIMVVLLRRFKKANSYE